MGRYQIRRDSIPVALQVERLWNSTLQADNSRLDAPDGDLAVVPLISEPRTRVPFHRLRLHPEL